jgi:hypothetical protein
MRWTEKDDQPGECFAFFPPDIESAFVVAGDELRMYKPI